jgi:predicted adenine nucleotide alpha hydrolase (AANH) superfamily ATPase
VPRLRGEGHDVTMFYSNSNIDTPEEFEKRLAAAKTLAEADSVELVADGYDHGSWLREVAAGLENAPEKGARCEKCFRFNLARTARYAAEHGFDAFATSLTVSPHKVSSRIFEASEDGRFLKADFKKRDGFKESLKRSSELGLYRQGYCGCEFSRKFPLA